MMNKKQIGIILREHLHVYEREIDLDQGLANTGILDSFGYIELIQFIEDKFEIIFNPGEMTMDTFKSINSIIAIIEKKLKEK